MTLRLDDARTEALRRKAAAEHRSMRADADGNLDSTAYSDAYERARRQRNAD
jgi:hypothetical protein